MAGRGRNAGKAEERVFVNYKLHEDAEHDLRDAATFYHAQAGEQLSQAFLTEFESTVNHLLKHPRLGPTWRRGKRRILNAAVSVFDNLRFSKRRDSDLCDRAS